MATTTRVAETLVDLMQVDGKAELIDGRIVHFMASGRKPGRVAFLITRSLDDHAGVTGRGEAYGDNVGFAVPRLASGRQSFSPDASYFLGPFPANEMRFLEGPPTFAAEVRSENDSTLAAERTMTAKRADYFEAGTLVVWDVDPVGQVIRKYCRDEPDRPETFVPGEVADAEPAVVGWRVDAARIFA